MARSRSRKSKSRSRSRSRSRSGSRKTVCKPYGNRTIYSKSGRKLSSWNKFVKKHSKGIKGPQQAKFKKLAVMYHKRRPGGSCAKRNSKSRSRSRR